MYSLTFFITLKQKVKSKKISCTKRKKLENGWSLGFPPVVTANT